MEREALLNFVRQHKIHTREQADQPTYGCVLFGFYGARETDFACQYSNFRVLVLHQAAQ